MPDPDVIPHGDWTGGLGVPVSAAGIGQAGTNAARVGRDRIDPMIAVHNESHICGDRSRPTNLHMWSRRSHWFEVVDTGSSVGPCPHLTTPSARCAWNARRSSASPRDRFASCHARHVRVRDTNRIEVTGED